MGAGLAHPSDEPPISQRKPTGFAGCRNSKRYEDCRPSIAIGKRKAQGEPAIGSFLGIAWLIFGGHSEHQGRFSIFCTFAYASALTLVAISHDYTPTALMLALEQISPNQSR
jgi:hypothetical protein